MKPETWNDIGYFAFLVVIVLALMWHHSVAENRSEHWVDYPCEIEKGNYVVPPGHLFDFKGMCSRPK